MGSSRTTAGNQEIVESLSSITFDIENKSFRATYDSARDSASFAVITVVSTALDRLPQNLTPLQSAIETDALDKLTADSSPELGNCSISFMYEGFEITVTTDSVEAAPVEKP